MIRLILTDNEGDRLAITAHESKIVFTALDGEPVHLSLDDADRLQAHLRTCLIAAGRPTLMTP